ncbi:MAG: hypothetical protein H7245_07550, partial [Candidatus Saccharibacteria bacterium]|nr:hypothetical protein [Pseudorhodobacter sp.]
QRLGQVFLRPAAGLVRLAEILQTPLILPLLGTPLRQCLQTKAEANGLKLQVVRKVDGQDPRRRAVLAGLGTTVFGAHLVAADLLGPVLLAHPIVNPVLTRLVVAKAHKDFDPTFVTLIRAALAGAWSGGQGGEAGPFAVGARHPAKYASDRRCPRACCLPLCAQTL